MRYAVIWLKSTLDTLAAFWISCADRNAVTSAVEEIDRLLGDDPGSRGEEYYGDRLLVATPFSVTFQVLEDDRVVEVLDVWHR